MSTSKKFSVAGVSTSPTGKTKLRFANDSMRVKILAKNGHEGINLINLPYEMSKSEIAAHFVEIDFAKGNEAIEAAIAYTAKKNPAQKQDTTSSVEVETPESILAEDIVTS
jgi:hypothetical protein